jgi:hypothetical protein
MANRLDQRPDSAHSPLAKTRTRFTQYQGENDGFFDLQGGAGLEHDLPHSTTPR